MMETDSGVLPAQASMTLYQEDQLSWLSSPEHHVECQWIHPERNQLEVAALGTEPAGQANQEYSVIPEVASRVVADLGASEPGPGCVLFRNTRPSSGLWEVLERPGLRVEEALGSASGFDVDPSSPIGHSKGGSEDSQGPLQGSAGYSHWCTEEESTRDWVVSLTNMTLSKVAPERVSIRMLRDSPCRPRDGQQNSTMWIGALNKPTSRTSCVSTAS